ncbi:MAG: TIGR00296 family protein [Nitrososphaerota archaeon]
MSLELSLDDGRFLVQLARRTITEYLNLRKVPNTPRDVPSKLLQKWGVFVTINTFIEGAEELRGCIGFPLPELPLVEATISAAVSAATRDPRFPPLTKKELQNIVVEVSVLTPPELISVREAKEYPNAIKIGRDGLIVEQGYFKGLLLPQVPVEWHWDSEEFLCNCCLKAGLPPDAWLLPGCKVYRFQAIIFKEKFPCGPVEQVVLS